MNQSNFAYYSLEPTRNELEVHLASHCGIGSEEEPLLVSMILRYADFADEGSVEHSRNNALETMTTLHETLSQVLIHDLKCSRNPAMQLGKVLETASLIAETDTYYSAVVAILYGERLIAAGVGHTSIWICRRGAFVRAMLPSIIIPPYGESNNFFLISALGVGFDSKKIQYCDMLLEPADSAIIAINALQDIGDKTFEISGVLSATDMLDKLIKDVQFKSDFFSIIKNVAHY